MNVCNFCWNVYKFGMEGDECYLLNCMGEIISADENLLQALKALNDKGYTTRFCCSAHVWQRYPRIYVQFAMACHFKTLPPGFQASTRYNPHAQTKITTISKSFSPKLSKIELGLGIFKASADLLIWSDSLKTFLEEYGFVAADDSSAET